MAVREMSIASKQSFRMSNRSLGILAMAGAPMLLAQMAAAHYLQKLVANPLIAFLGVLYIGGWIASAVGIRRLRVAGKRQSSKVIYIVQMVMLSLALLFSVQDTLGIKEGIFFSLTDAAYPLSHLMMLVVGIFIWRAQVWHGLSRIAPLLVGFALPITFAIAPLVGWNGAGICFAALTMTGFLLMGHAVFKATQA